MGAAAEFMQMDARSCEDVLRAVLDERGEALLVLGTDRELLALNRAARDLLGPSACTGQPLDWPHSLRTEESSEVVLTDALGSTRTLQAAVHAVTWSGRHALLLTLRDLTPLREMEQALVLGRRAMDASPHGIVIADASDPELPLIYANEAFERLTGYQRSAILGRNCRFLQRRERDQPELDRLRTALARAEPVTVVLRNFRRDGSPFWNEVSISPVRNAAGTVTHFVGIQVDITERLRQQEELAKRSTSDSLTGLPNRTLLLDRARQALALARRHGRLPAALLIEMEQFKELNDSLGHEVGDQLIVEAVKRLQSCLRQGDTLARLSGDEFVVLLPDLACAEDAAPIADKLMHALSQPYLHAEGSFYCGCRIGIAVAHRDEEDETRLIQQAGIAAHAARGLGRSAVHFYSGELAERVSDRLVMRAQLHEAITRGEFELHFQPQLDLRRDRISGIEALVRWQHPQWGRVSPMRFIPVAEESGQIVAIGRWVLEQACRQHRAWLEARLLDCPIAVNVSALQFMQGDFVDVVAEVLASTGLPANRLELELTESVTMDAGEKTQETLRRLREVGVTLSIDDFGTGFSSLGYLKRLPIDKIKIDRSFVRDIVHDSDDAAITLGVIAMAHHLRLRVVAEGVESAAQLAFLKRHGCDEIQGHHLSPPLPAADLEPFVREFSPPLASDDDARPTVLLVDDEPNVVRALARALRRDGYRILTADGAAAAFEVLAQHEVQVILSDQRMPQMCGTEFLSEVKSLYPHTVRIVLSGYTDLQSVTDAINRGAIYRFLTKPWEDEALRAHVKEAFRHHERQRREATREASTAENTPKTTPDACAAADDRVGGQTAQLAGSER